MDIHNNTVKSDHKNILSTVLNFWNYVDQITCSIREKIIMESEETGGFLKTSNYVLLLGMDNDCIYMFYSMNNNQGYNC